MKHAARTASGIVATLLIFLATTAHVGSPDTWFEGKAGPYRVRVLIRSPQVIPARAEIVVRILGCDSAPRCAVRQVTATPKIWNGGPQGAPPPDAATPVPGDSSLYALTLWIMRQGSYAVLVHVDGAAGSGTAVVPYTAVATAVLGMKRPFALGLSAFGLFLAFGLITIVGAATREATLAPGLVPDIPARRRSLRARIIAAVVIVVVLTGGRAWWNAENRAYADAVSRPLPARARIVERDSGRMRAIAVEPAAATDRAPWALIPDHGKLMHLFLVKADGLGALAHLHPVPRDSFLYEAALPPLPPGRYRLYADVVNESGFAGTMVDTLTIDSAGGTWVPTDADDAFFVGSASAREPGVVVEWAAPPAPRVAGREADLDFVVRDASGAAVGLEPYMGMTGHAVVVREDGAVFVHLHPAGTASAGAQQALMAWTPADTARGSISARLRGAPAAMMGMTPGTAPGTLHFPYAFPSAGRYRVWVQFRQGGRIHTAAFDVTVRASPADANAS